VQGHDEHSERIGRHKRLGGIIEMQRKQEEFSMNKTLLSERVGGVDMKMGGKGRLLLLLALLDVL